MKVTLSLTHRCNLVCRYCYAGRAFRQDMSLETTCKAVDFAIRITPPGEKIDFCFFGGEPFLCCDRMQTITTYIRKRAQDAGYPVRLAKSASIP